MNCSTRFPPDTCPISFLGEVQSELQAVCALFRKKMTQYKITLLVCKVYKLSVFCFWCFKWVNCSTLSLKHDICWSFFYDLSSFVNFSMFVANRIISWFIFSNMKSILYLKGHTLDFSTQTRIFAPISHFSITSPRQLSMKISPISNCNLKSPLPI